MTATFFVFGWGPPAQDTLLAKIQNRRTLSQSPQPSFDPRLACSAHHTRSASTPGAAYTHISSGMRAYQQPHARTSATCVWNVCVPNGYLPRRRTFALIRHTTVADGIRRGQSEKAKDQGNAERAVTPAENRHRALLVPGPAGARGTPALSGGHLLW